MVPDVLAKTPAYIDRVRPGSLAEKAGVQSNDLILFVNDQRVDSQKGLDRILQTIQRNDSFSILVQRGNALARVQVRP